MDDNLPFQQIFVFFKRSIPSGISISNRHLLILDEHGSHVTLKAIEQARVFGLDMVILFLHTLHALTFGRGLLQTFQDYFQKGKRHTNG
jgi:hypothetical protein